MTYRKYCITCDKLVLGGYENHNHTQIHNKRLRKYTDKNTEANEFYEHYDVLADINIELQNLYTEKLSIEEELKLLDIELKKEQEKKKLLCEELKTIKVPQGIICHEYENKYNKSLLNKGKIKKKNSIIKKLDEYTTEVTKCELLLNEDMSVCNDKKYVKFIKYKKVDKNKLTNYIDNKKIKIEKLNEELEKFNVYIPENVLPISEETMNKINNIGVKQKELMEQKRKERLEKNKINYQKLKLKKQQKRNNERTNESDNESVNSNNTIVSNISLNESLSSNGLSNESLNEKNELINLNEKNESVNLNLTGKKIKKNKKQKIIQNNYENIHEMNNEEDYLYENVTSDIYMDDETKKLFDDTIIPYTRKAAFELYDYMVKYAKSKKINIQDIMYMYNFHKYADPYDHRSVLLDDLTLTHILNILLIPIISKLSYYLGIDNIVSIYNTEFKEKFPENYC